MTIPQVRAADAHRLLNELPAQGQAPVLLDVREPWEFATASVPLSEPQQVQIPMQQVPASLGRLDAKQPVFVMCHHGMRSQQVALFLQAKGFAEVYNVAGGIDAWSHEVDPQVPTY